MRLTPAEYRRLPHRRITLLGMSGVGKTYLSNMLRREDWFHYSGDYRIGTRYLSEPILDNIKAQAMQVPFLRTLLRTDSIQIINNITVDNLNPVSSFLGKLGNPERGGLSLTEFKRRQALHHEAEVSAMLDVPDFIHKAQVLFGYPHFINDAGGSVSELEAPEVLETLAQHTLIIYIKASEQNERELIARAERDPKPLYYREAFLDEQLTRYMVAHELEYVAQIDPDDFVRWVFPHLFRARLPRYEAIARDYGYTILSSELAQIDSTAEFDDLVEQALEREGPD
ncbi:ATPase [Thioalkalivibrio sp.]|uniref:ATPase n=1 Tax=Thioalkalivibrio sp. TaxID=2093813 RepID=UPI0012D55604|nr:ATPase [Thioalkalivibrio sp.]TVP83077.1 MAG: ATPase [Thioalkalivibrio sp.]